jgi:hypothetical protein
VKYVLYFHISTCRSLCAVPNMAVCCSSLISCFPGTSLRYCLSDLRWLQRPYYYYCYYYGGPGSLVGIVTDYGLDGPGIQSRWGRDFPRLSRPALGPTQPPAQWVPCLSPGVKCAGRAADHSLPSSAEVTEE